MKYRSGAVPATFLSAVCEGAGCLPHCKAGTSGGRKQTGSRKEKGPDATGENEQKGGSGLLLGIRQGPREREATRNVNSIMCVLTESVIYLRRFHL